MQRCIAIVCLLAAALLNAESVTAQSEATPTDAAMAITADEVRRHVAVIAHDSMTGRDTPNAGIEKTAQYVADQFKALGLKPAGDPPTGMSVVSGSGEPSPVPWLQRYPRLGSLHGSPDAIMLFTARPTRHGKYVIDEVGRPRDIVTRVAFRSDARFGIDTIPERLFGTPWVPAVQTRMHLLTGRQTPESIRRAQVDENVVLFVPPAGLDSAAVRKIVRELAATSHVVTLVDEDSVTFAARRNKAFEYPPVAVNAAFGWRVRSHVAVDVWPGAVRAFLASARLDLASLRADTVPRVRDVPFVGVTFTGPATMPTDGDSATGVNVAAVMPPTDSASPLRRQFIVVAAHMDNVDVARGAPGGIRDGTNARASGVAGLLALAKAFTRPGVRLKRPVIFLATSDGAPGKGQWGAQAYAEESIDNGLGIFALDRIGFSLALDLIGHLPGDSLLMNGFSDVEFAVRPDWLAAQHPELGLKLVDGGTAFTMESDHIAYAARGIPSLFVHGASQGDSVRVLDKRNDVDPEQEMRAVRMIYYLIQDLANRDRLPLWTPAGREQRARFLGR